MKDEYVKLHDVIRDMVLWVACDCQSSIIDRLDCLEGHSKALGINVSTDSDLEKLVRPSRIPIRALNMHTAN